MKIGVPAGPVGAGSGQGLEGAVTLTRPSPWPGTVCLECSVCDLTATLHEWEWSLHPPRRTKRLQGNVKSMIRILASWVDAPASPVWPH